MVEIESQLMAEMNDGMGFPFLLARKGGRKHRTLLLMAFRSQSGLITRRCGKGNTLILPCRNPPFRRDAREAEGRGEGETGVCNLTESLHIEWVHRGSAL